MSYVKHAQKEFYMAGWCDKDGNFECEMQEMMCKGVLELLEVFSKQGHSGSSAPYAIDLFKKLASFSIITPLTGEDKEWAKVSEQDGEEIYQNVRLSSIFKRGKSGTPYNIDGKVFYNLYKDEDTGEVYRSGYTSSDSCVDVEFPYTPKDPEYVFVPNEEFSEDVTKSN